jgi:cytochrome c oxidase subunit 4
VAAVLALLTAVEVGLYYLKNGLTYIPLLALMAAKFVIVVGYFMHLKFDNKAFRRLFTIGLVLASFCYCSVLLMFGVLHF